MTLRARFLLYLAIVHLLFAGVAALLVRHNRLWLIAIEAAFVISFASGYALLRKLFSVLTFVGEGAELLAERDFTSRFRGVGQPELDRLVEMYNRMAGHLRDERIRIEEQHYFLSNILAVSPSGIIVLDYDGGIDHVNPASERLLQASAAALKGKTIAEAGGPLGGEVATLRPGESRVLSLWGGRRVRCHRGSFIDRGFSRSFVLMEELTDELRQSEKAAYEKLIRMLSHEVNNTVGASNSLLHSCLAFAGQLPEGARTDYEHALRVVIGRTDQLNRFMRSFADVIRLPAPTKTSCDVREVLDGIAALMRPQLEERAIAWQWDVREPIGAIRMDRAQMEQALVNVLKNAAEAIGRQGLITVRLGPRNGRPSVTIEDSGPGISAEARANLFTPFFSTKEHGQGIGLTLVQEILTQHRFDYSLDSREGGPTEFTIVF